jgi:hypothetical protein
VLRDELHAAAAAAHWTYLTGTIGHYSRLAAALTADERTALSDALADRLAPFRRDGELRLSRAIVLVSGRR